MKLLIDTNVILDIALNRRPFIEHASLLWRLAEQKQIVACLSNTSITDIYYICRKYVGKETARDFISDLLDIFLILNIDVQGFRQALDSGINDFEDAVQYIVCLNNNCNALITRNKSDFDNKIRVFSPSELIEQLNPGFIQS